jgi:hypothetical protein
MLAFHQLIIFIKILHMHNIKQPISDILKSIMNSVLVYKYPASHSQPPTRGGATLSGNQ